MLWNEKNHCLTGSQHFCPTAHLHRQGFTLIEVLVVTGVITILMGILLPVLSKARQCAYLTGELSAARQFAAAHAMYSNDCDGEVMPGFASDGMVQRGDVNARNDRGGTLQGLEAQRYPWRLMPFIENSVDLLFRDHRRMKQDLQAASYDYGVSVAPRFGLNQAFVGGSADHDGTGYAFLASPALRARVAASWPARWYAARITDAPDPSRLLSFASASGANPVDGVTVDGFYRVTPPIFTSRRWRTEPPDSGAALSETGNVDFRFAGRTVAAMMDGHAQSLNWSESQDMRRWAPRATSEDWMLPRLQ